MKELFLIIIVGAFCFAIVKAVNEANKGYEHNKRYEYNKIHTNKKIIYQI